MVFEYAAKFVYGKSPGYVAATGYYFTTINVHNPWEKPVAVQKKFAVGLPREESGPVSEFFKQQLGPDRVMEVDGRDIMGHLKLRVAFATGFAVLRCERELDVVAVYTVADSKDGMARSIHVERVPARKIE